MAAHGVPAGSRRCAMAMGKGTDEGVRGLFLTLEGIDGCGKTTQSRLLAESLEAMGIETLCLREPGGTDVSERIRSLVLDPACEGMADECELLLYEASRAQLVREVIGPALAMGRLVVCDRYLDSTLAYQAGGRGLPESVVASANAVGSCGVVPDRTILLDVDPEIALTRATRGGTDRLEAEGLAFQRRVRERYLRLAHDEPARVVVVDATGTPGEVRARVAAALADLVPGLPQEGDDA